MSKLDLLRAIGTGVSLSKCVRIQEFTQDNIKTLLNGPKCPPMVVDVSLLRKSRMNSRPSIGKRGSSTSTQGTRFWPLSPLADSILLFLLLLISILIYNI